LFITVLKIRNTKYKIPIVTWSRWCVAGAELHGIERTSYLGCFLLSLNSAYQIHYYITSIPGPSFEGRELNLPILKASLRREVGGMSY
tara:strand:+ start:25774 stop:26037 length:264 start_codon:yes stop_codon:yes gene_type:complete